MPGLELRSLSVASAISGLSASRASRPSTQSSGDAESLPTPGRSDVPRGLQRLTLWTRPARCKPGFGPWLSRFMALGLALAPLGIGRAQSGNPAAATMNRALELEAANNCRDAIPLYRQATRVPDPTGAVLGLERCLHMVGHPDSLLPLLDTLFVRKPTDPTLRVVQLRTLSTVRNDAGLKRAFSEWVALAPREPAPYREYARILLDMGRALAADSVLASAERALGSKTEIAAEFAQMQAALGLWTKAAQSWREASQHRSYLERAAVFSLFQAPAELRDSIRQILREPPVAVNARRVLAGLEVRWHAPLEGWAALSELQPTDTVIRIWTDFAAEAEDSEAWLTARDAWVSAFKARPSERGYAVRAANAALSGDDPASAAGVLASLTGERDSTLAPTVTLLRVRALGMMGQPRAADSLLRANDKVLDVAARQQAHRSLAWAWIRSGDLEGARSALAEAGGDTEEGERVSAWISLYEGDLAAARSGLRRTDESSNDVVTAMAFLSRTRVGRSDEAGKAFLQLARGDTAQAALMFERAADGLKDAASFLLGTSARLHLAVSDTSRSITLWQLILSAHSDAPEAAESDLEWARVLRRRGDNAAAIERLEHLILTYSESALVPQARRELELARRAVPSGLVQGSSVGGRWRASGSVSCLAGAAAFLAPPVARYDGSGCRA